MEVTIEDLIKKTLRHIDIALSTHLPSDAKLYAETLFFLKQAQNILPLQHIPTFKTASPTDWVHMKPFESINEKHV